MAEAVETDPSVEVTKESNSPSIGRSSSDISAPDQNTSRVPNQRSASFSHTTGVKTPEEVPGKASPASGFSQWARGFKLPTSSESASGSEGAKMSPFSLLTSGFGKRVPAKSPVVDTPNEGTSTAVPVQEVNAFGTFTKGFLDSSRNAVRNVQLKARHLVSQNKRRYQEGGFDLDMAYITENIIAMGFPAGDMSSGLLGYVEGFYRNHMEEVMKFFETNHKGKYKVYNLCSERLYDASLFEGKVACFPFDDHNCPPLQLMAAFCQSAYSWLKGDLENVVVVHCKAGMARTGLMITCLLLYLKFFPTAEESINYYNQKRCVDGKGLVLPSQLQVGDVQPIFHEIGYNKPLCNVITHRCYDVQRYVKYFERVLKDFNGETPQGRKCILRGIRLHKCPYWVRPAITISDHNGVLFSSKKHPRTKDLLSEDIWFSAPRKGVVVFALPGERCVADLNGDFKVHFNDRHGDFYCWLNTNMMETRQILPTTELDGFEKRRLPSPGFQVEVVILDHDAPIPKKKTAESAVTQSAATGTELPTTSMSNEAITQDTTSSSPGNDVPADSKDGEEDIFTDSEGEDEDGNKVKMRRKRSLTKDVTGHAGNSSSGHVGEDPHVPAVPVEMTDGASYQNTSDLVRDAVKDDRAIVAEKVEDISVKTAVGPQSNAKVVSDVSFRHDESPKNAAVAPSDFKAIAAASAADASVFTFGDDDDYDSDEDQQ